MSSPGSLLQNPFWRVEVAPKAPQITGLWADPREKREYGENLLDVADVPRRPYWHNRLEDPLCGVSGIQAEKAVCWSRDCRTTWKRSHNGKASSLQTGVFSYAKGIRERWTIRLAEDVFEIQLIRTIAPNVKLNSTLGFLLHTPRDFAFRHVPQIRNAEVEWHEVDTSRQRCLLHASGAYCDLEAWTKNGPLHLMSRYLHHQAIGVALPTGKPGTYRCSLYLRPVAQGTRVPIHFQTPHAEVGRLATEFYDTYRLANISHIGIPGNGPYHGCMCTTDLVGNTLPDGIACRRPVPVGVDELRQSTQRLLQLCADGAFGEKGVINGVHMLGRWHKGCGDAEDVFMLDTGAHIALAIYHHFVHTGDRAWLKKMFPTACRAVNLILRMDRDRDGLIEAQTTGLPNSRASNFWDEIKYGYKDAYANVWLYGALKAMVELCELVSDRQQRGRYQRHLNRLYRAFNRQLWNPKTNRYVGWIDIRGGLHDAFYVSPNLLAIIFGLAPPRRAISILQGIDNSPHAYRLFAISSNLEA
ncbi:MAG: hypothetical protein HY646_03340, partial [Acidobacteria bacterium]|nr:hypothetical protein [Acidobacteriota bacterium]